MRIDPAIGVFRYDDIYELNYAVLNAIGLVVNHQGYVFDNDSKSQVFVNGKALKASIDVNRIVYPGPNEIMLDLLRNIKLVTFLLGYHIDKKIQTQGMNFMSQYIEEVENDTRTALTVKFDTMNSVSSGYFNNKCLKYVHMILILEEEAVDLLNFDSLE